MDVLMGSMEGQQSGIARAMQRVPADAPPKQARMRDEPTTEAEFTAKLVIQNRTIADNTRMRIARAKERHREAIAEMMASHQVETASVADIQAQGVAEVTDGIKAIQAEIDRLKDKKTALEARKTTMQDNNAVALANLAFAQKARLDACEADYRASMDDMERALAMAEAALAAGAKEVG